MKRPLTQRPLPWLAAALVLVLAACGTAPEPEPDPDPGNVVDDGLATYGEAIHRAEAVALDLQNLMERAWREDEATPAALTQLMPFIGHLSSDLGGTELPRGAYVFDAGSYVPEPDAEAPAPSAAVEAPYDLRLSGGYASETAVLRVDWDVDGAEPVVIEVDETTLELPVHARLVLEDEGEELARVDVTAAWPAPDAAACRPLAPEELSVAGTIGGLTIDVTAAIGDASSFAARLGYGGLAVSLAGAMDADLVAFAACGEPKPTEISFGLALDRPLGSEALEVTLDELAWAEEYSGLVGFALEGAVSFDGIAKILVAGALSPDADGYGPEVEVTFEDATMPLWTFAQALVEKFEGEDGESFSILRLLDAAPALLSLD